MTKFAVLLILTISVFELNGVTGLWSSREVSLTRSCPNIISRSGWNARSPTRVIPLSSPVPYVIIHHSVTPMCDSESSCARRVRNIQTGHMNDNGWDDIAYNFLIGGDGTVFEGRGWDIQGEHAGSLYYNRRSIGICFIGNFEDQQPTTAQISSAKNLIWCGVSQNKIRRDYILYGHKDVRPRGTLCPGRNLYSNIQTWPRENPQFLFVR